MKKQYKQWCDEHGYYERSAIAHAIYTRETSDVGIRYLDERSFNEKEYSKASKRLETKNAY